MKTKWPIYAVESKKSTDYVMIKLISYENIWVRNIVFGSIMLGLAIAQNQIAPDSIDGKPEDSLELILTFIGIYIILLIYNQFVVRNILFVKKYRNFIILTTLYIFAVAILFLYVSISTGDSTTFMAELLSSIFLIVIGTSFYFIHLWILENIISSRRKLHKKEAELTFLKQQLSPHFLFNALNNLYGTALSAPNLISDKILELSDLLRYQVGSTTKEEVMIEEEMQFVENYLHYTNYKTNNLVVTNVVYGETKKRSIPPLLFLPLLENAIKFSTETERPFINITWRFEDLTFSFLIDNAYLIEGSNSNGTKVGIENLTKRLELLKIKHKLTIDITTLGCYKVELKLWGMSTSA